MSGYCKKYAWKMTAKEVRKMGCVNEKKQCKYSRKRCVYFVPNVFLVSTEERVCRKEMPAICAQNY